jgi:hypothetical protein
MIDPFQLNGPSYDNECAYFAQLETEESMEKVSVVKGLKNSPTTFSTHALKGYLQKQ